MQVRMQMQILAPGVEYGKEADGRSEMLGIGCDGEQSFGSSAEQSVVNLLGILKSQASQFLRESKHDVEVRDGQELGLPLRKPLGARRSLALRTVPVAAGVI
jgi:hypothetical protein